MKRLRFGMLAVVLTMVFSAMAIAGELKIGSVNLQKALNECQAGKEAISELDAEVKKRQEQIDQKQEELKKSNDEMEKKKAVWNDETKEQKQKEFQARMQEFQRFFSQSNEDIRRREQEKKGVIIKDLIEVVKKLAKEKGYAFIFEAQSAVIYSQAEADITDEIIKLYDAEYKKTKKENK